ncbi:DUF3800 domain-containing protein [Tenacibaculum finnmarkense]|uniref:DUF3800 domain-containing protein n=1 Tax=Tenacibaculum finnmarkense genomovar ulcerans TaxID=2781388 RepID=A0A2I2M7P7_9FLAO|nr:DUF3800 domain-containing protein [Tenacibaculum finnmarkense]MBE7698574.1 DUF3800 domain-containing protein [Tenacibaculum finnmarkense genomovar ulcerans]SOU88565.1 conserved hypothetical protein [Tenacibaculum finnmarkense genomovar ulcerans]
MEKAYIFIDEYGNSHLDLSKNSTPSHFIYSSIIIKESDLNKARELRKEICKKHRLGADIKSKNIKKKFFERRLNILKDLKENLDFTIDVLVIDKEKLNFETGGLKHKQVFYKYFQKTFVTKYNNIYNSFSIYLDKLGHDNFRNELVKFVSEKGIQRDLFNPNRTYELADDKTEEKLVQFADIIAGSIGRVFCLSDFEEEYNQIYEILHTRMSVSYFPYLKSKTNLISNSPKLTKEITELNLEVLKNYMDNTLKSENHLKRRLLEYLYTSSKIDSERLVPSYEIVNYLKNFTKKIDEPKLRIIVRDLRYEGLFIISHSGKPGYKLASNYQDIEMHFTHFMKYIIPMLKKIEILNQKISQLSFNKINPLEKDEQFIQIKKLIEQTKN